MGASPSFWQPETFPDTYLEEDTNIPSLPLPNFTFQKFGVQEIEELKTLGVLPHIHTPNIKTKSEMSVCMCITELSCIDLLLD